MESLAFDTAKSHCVFLNTDLTLNTDLRKRKPKKHNFAQKSKILKRGLGDFALKKKRSEKSSRRATRSNSLGFSIGILVGNPTGQDFLN